MASAPLAAERFEGLCREALLAELEHIGRWWLDHAIDHHQGGFFGEIDSQNNANIHANKGIVMNSRILWFYSEAVDFLRQYNVNDKVIGEYSAAADRAFDYIIDHFDDKQYGGCVWELDAKGNTVNGKKQTYAQSFCIYAFSAYYKITNNNLALDKAMHYFDLLETHAKDHVNQGYIEAYQQNWQALSDFRLSAKDMNVPKSMNTHLHVLEAYAALHNVAPSAKTEQALADIIAVFVERIYDENNKHLKLFFNSDWSDCSATVSYGHDIEASWLLWEALEILNNPVISAKYQPVVMALAQSCFEEAIGDHGHICDEYDTHTQCRHQYSYWWVQAEAIVGFLNALRLGGNSKYRQVCDDIWHFIQQYHKDDQQGEWHWTATLHQHPKSANPTYKAGFWKGPYHSGRAMMEAVKLLDNMGE